MSLYAIGDLHLSFGSDKPMDIFTGWQDYVSKIKKNWENIVKETDTVVIPGDVSWAMDFDSLRPDFDFIDRLPGSKLIIKGNHDYWWSTMAKMGRFIEQEGFGTIRIVHNTAAPAEGVCVCGTRGWFYDSSLNEDKKVLYREAGRLRTSILRAKETGLEPVVFLHFPPIYGGFVCEEIVGILKEFHIRRCYYAHLHGKSAGRAYEGLHEGILYRLVSCDHIGFSPFRVE